jgi:hypothetical protein
VEEEPNAEDREHLSALSIGHFILAGVALFSGIPTLVLAVAGASAVDELGPSLSILMGDVSGQQPADPFGGGTDAMIQSVETLMVTAIVAGLAVALISTIHLVVVGVKIRQRRWWTFCYLTGWGECLMFPFGTILGIFTIIVLGRPSVKKLFGVR